MVVVVVLYAVLRVCPIERGSGRAVDLWDAVIKCYLI